MSTPQRKGSNGGASTSKGHLCKRADIHELYAALTPGNMRFIFKENQYASVYLLHRQLDGKHAVLKILQNGMSEEEQILEEISALRMNRQLIGWGHTPNRELYYIFMEYMGVPLARTPFAHNANIVQHLKQAAIQRYHFNHGLVHTDQADNESNWTYRQVQTPAGQVVWQAELIDWEFYEMAQGHHYAPVNPQSAIIFDPACGIFVPEGMEHHLEAAAEESSDEEE